MGNSEYPDWRPRGMLMSSDFAHSSAMAWPQNFSTRYKLRSDRRVDTAAAEQPTVLRNKVFRSPHDIGIALSKVLGQRPMRRRLPAVEQSGFGEQRNARADTCDICALGMHLAQPGQQVRPLRDLILHIPARRRQDDDVAVLN